MIPHVLPPTASAPRTDTELASQLPELHLPEQSLTEQPSADSPASTGGPTPIDNEATRTADTDKDAS